MTSDKEWMVRAMVAPSRSPDNQVRSFAPLCIDSMPSTKFVPLMKSSTRKIVPYSWRWMPTVSAWYSHSIAPMVQLPILGCPIRPVATNVRSDVVLPSEELQGICSTWVANGKFISNSAP